MKHKGSDMPRAVVNGTVVAESDSFEVADRAVFFPPEAINREFFKDSTLHSICPWKGVASYYTLNVDGTELQDVAWFYPRPSKAAAHIKGHIAFYPAVTVEMDQGG
jgi:uncharacterized protein (DUF427 family)